MLRFIISNTLLVAGLFFISASVVGLYRFPNCHSKIHALGVSDTVGIFFLLLGTALYNTPSFMYVLKILITVGILSITTVMSSVTVARLKQRTMSKAKK